MREFTGRAEDCFYRYKESEEENAREFTWFANCNPQLDFYWPNYKASPWHIKCMININGDEVEMNFWPHKSKGQFKYEKAIEPLSAFIDELNTRLNDVEDDFDVVE